jgi:predicted CopG family antitoxin
MNIDMIKELYKNKITSDLNLEINDLAIYSTKDRLRQRSAKEEKVFNVGPYKTCDFMVEVKYGLPYLIEGKVTFSSVESELIKRDKKLNELLKDYDFKLTSNAMAVDRFDPERSDFSFTIKEFYKFDKNKNKTVSFSKVLKEVKAGKKIARKGWNGNGMFVYYVGEDKYKAKTKAAKKTFGKCVPYLPYLALKTVDDNVVPWTISQTDVLAEDWYIID